MHAPGMHTHFYDSWTTQEGWKVPGGLFHCLSVVAIPNQSAIALNKENGNCCSRHWAHRAREMKVDLTEAAKAMKLRCSSWIKQVEEFRKSLSCKSPSGEQETRGEDQTRDEADCFITEQQEEQEQGDEGRSSYESNNDHDAEKHRRRMRSWLVSTSPHLVFRKTEQRLLEVVEKPRTGVLDEQLYSRVGAKANNEHACDKESAPAEEAQAGSDETNKNYSEPVINDPVLECLVTNPSSRTRGTKNRAGEMLDAKMTCAAAPQDVVDDHASLMPHSPSVMDLPLKVASRVVVDDNDMNVNSANNATCDLLYEMKDVSVATIVKSSSEQHLQFLEAGISNIEEGEHSCRTDIQDAQNRSSYGAQDSLLDCFPTTRSSVPSSSRGQQVIVDEIDQILLEPPPPSAEIKRSPGDIKRSHPTEEEPEETKNSTRITTTSSAFAGSNIRKQESCIREDLQTQTTRRSSNGSPRSTSMRRVSFDSTGQTQSKRTKSKSPPPASPKTRSSSKTSANKMSRSARSSKSSSPVIDARGSVNEQKRPSSTEERKTCSSSERKKATSTRKNSPTTVSRSTRNSPSTVSRFPPTAEPGMVRLKTTPGVKRMVDSLLTEQRDQPVGPTLMSLRMLRPSLEAPFLKAKQLGNKWLTAVRNEKIRKVESADEISGHLAGAEEPTSRQSGQDGGGEAPPVVVSSSSHPVGIKTKTPVSGRREPEIEPDHVSTSTFFKLTSSSGMRFSPYDRSPASSRTAANMMNGAAPRLNLNVKNDNNYSQLHQQSHTSTPTFTRQPPIPISTASTTTTPPVASPVRLQVDPSRMSTSRVSSRRPSAVGQNRVLYINSPRLPASPRLGSPRPVNMPTAATSSREPRYSTEQRRTGEWRH
ncbi:unnamed protein product [Amoebophrya sp. A25]|nr:unnamed protein product [Amoebophrya sp. A25]|eukprot:GSA25T00025732001.1